MNLQFLFLGMPEKLVPEKQLLRIESEKLNFSFDCSMLPQKGQFGRILLGPHQSPDHES